MATYKVKELLNTLHEIANDGYEYVEVMEIEDEDEYPPFLSFSAIANSFMNIDYDSIDSCEVPENYDSKAF